MHRMPDRCLRSLAPLPFQCVTGPSRGLLERALASTPAQALRGLRCELIASAVAPKMQHAKAFSFPFFFLLRRVSCACSVCVLLGSVFLLAPPHAARCVSSREEMCCIHQFKGCAHCLRGLVVLFFSRSAKYPLLNFFTRI